MKTVVVICYAEPAHLEPVQAWLADKPTLALGQLAQGHDAEVPHDELLRTLIEAAGVRLDAAPQLGWGRRVQPGFDAAVTQTLQEFRRCADPVWIVPSVYNAYFVDAWRSLARRMGLSVRFVHVRNFSGLQPNVTGPRLSMAEFRTTWCMALQAGPDVACFDLADWRSAANLADTAMRGILRASSESRGLPVAHLVDVLRVSPVMARQDLPSELVALTSIFEGKHLGAPLVVPAGVDLAARLGNAGDPGSAVCHWIRATAGNDASVHERAMTQELTASSGFERDFSAGSAKAEYLAQLACAREELAQVRARIEELKAVSSKQVAESAVPAAGVVNPAGIQFAPGVLLRGGRRVDSRGVRSSKAARLWRKFRLDPAQYFADSRFPLLRRLGAIVWRSPT